MSTRINIAALDLMDVEAPGMDAPRSTMSALQAFDVALASEQKAFDFYDEALANPLPGADIEVEEDEDDRPAL